MATASLPLCGRPLRHVTCEKGVSPCGTGAHPSPISSTTPGAAARFAVDLRAGREIAATGGVELVKRGPLRVIAQVTGTQTHTVELLSTPSGLEWSCTCGDAKERSFCRHCVAAALENRWRSPGRRIA